GENLPASSKSELTSTIINPDGDICVTFWYNIDRENVGPLSVYIESGNTTHIHWSQFGNFQHTWKYVNFTISKSEPYRIIFKGVHGSGYWSRIALDDISLHERSCSGLITTSQECHNIDEPISLNECSKYYLQPNDTFLVFDPEVDNCSFVYQDVKISVTTACIDLNKSDICTFDFPEPKMEHKRCFQSNWLSVEYRCEADVTDTLSSVDTSSKGSSEVAETTTVTSETFSSVGSSAGDGTTVTTISSVINAREDISSGRAE
ncbi:Hypothetical predicted protein, partial [Mytilus galloprovincialis]